MFPTWRNWRGSCRQIASRISSRFCLGLQPQERGGTEAGRKVRLLVVHQKKIGGRLKQFFHVPAREYFWGFLSVRDLEIRNALLLDREGAVSIWNCQTRQVENTFALDV